jgi:LCP family protein required for cell wall assembly
VLSILLLGNATALGAWWLMDSADTAFRENAVRLEEVVPELDVRSEGPREPMFFLLIGSDSREGVDTKQFGDFKGARGDVVMVARVDPQEGKAQILSIPRDTWVPIEGHGEGKINSAYAYGGPSLMVKTVRELTGAPIHHYVEVDFAGFQALVDEIGGVEMTFDYPARDPKSKLDIPGGTVILDGFQALAYARSRSYQELRDGQWVSVDATDIGRTERQQTLVLAILDQLKRPSTLAETGDIVASIAQHMTVDAALADSSLTQLAFSLREIGPSDIETATLPTEGATRGGASIQVLEQPAAAAMLEAFRTGSPLDVEGGDAIVTVDVLNANGIAGNAGRWASRLGELGYTVNRVDNADGREDTTVVIVGQNRAIAGEVLIDQLGFGSVEVGPVPEGVDAVVLLGADAGDPAS